MHRDPKQVMCSKAFSIFFIATLSWVSSSCPSFPTNIGDHMPWVLKYQALSELPKTLHFFRLIRVTFNNSNIFCLNQPTWFEHPKITPTHPTWFQAPALHKRCHRHLDLLALAQSTFRFNSDSLVVGGWWMSIVKMLKWRKIPDSGSVFHCWPSQLVKDFVHGLYNACLTMVCHNHFCTDWMNWDQIHKKSSVPINLIQV